MKRSIRPRNHLDRKAVPGYYRFYDRWKEEDTPSADALSVRAPSQGSEPAAQAPASPLYHGASDPLLAGRRQRRRPSSARGEWKKSNNRLTRYGKNYRYVRPAEDVTPAWFKVRIPTDGFYTVYARWPAAKGNNPKTRFQISTASGLKKVKVNQRRDGGVWMRLGAYKMNAGNRYSVRVGGRSKAEGRVVADAVMVVAGTQAAPQAGNDGTSSDGGAPATYGPFSVGGETIMDGKAGLGGDRKGEDAPRHTLHALTSDALHGLPIGGLLLLYQPGLQRVGDDA